MNKKTLIASQTINQFFFIDLNYGIYLFVLEFFLFRINNLFLEETSMNPK